MQPRRVALILLPLLVLGASACSTLGFQDSEFVFQESQRHYTQYIRWERFDAARTFVDPKALADFRSQIASLSDVRFTDYAVHGTEMGPDGETAVVHVTYYAYLQSSPVALALDEEQHWHKVEGEREWRVRSSFAQRALQPGEGML
jgi:hypothetical protein